jgi:hypothetical protein
MGPRKIEPAILAKNAFADKPYWGFIFAGPENVKFFGHV